MLHGHSLEHRRQEFFNQCFQEMDFDPPLWLLSCGDSHVSTKGLHEHWAWLRERACQPIYLVSKARLHMRLEKLAGTCVTYHRSNLP